MKRALSRLHKIVTANTGWKQRQEENVSQAMCRFVLAWVLHLHLHRLVYRIFLICFDLMFFTNNVKCFSNNEMMDRVA